MKRNWFALEGSPSPQGATWIEEEKAYNFVIYSENAVAVTLLLYNEDDALNPALQYRFDPIRNKSGRIWHCRIPKSSVDRAVYYGYKVEGPFDPSRGHRFDPEKILLDPYAKTVCFPPDFSREAAREPGSNAGKAPLGLIDPHRASFDWGTDQRPRHSSDKIIYELHVRGFTMRSNSGVTPGTKAPIPVLSKRYLISKILALRS
jgi:isoamylase